MARRCGHRTDIREHLLLFGVAPMAGFAVLSFARPGDDIGEAVWRFGGLTGLFAPLLLLLLWQRLVPGRAYDERWRKVCHLLGEDLLHEGGVVRGSWKGRRFFASATSYTRGRHRETVSEYRVSMATGLPGPAWRADRADPGTGARGSHLWTLRAGTRSAEERLVGAGLLTAIEEAEQRAVHLHPGARLSFAPDTGRVSYEDTSGEPPCAADLVVHLDLVRRAVDVHAEAMAPSDGPSGAGPRLPVDDTPLWVLGLCYPTALVVFVTVDRWPWSFALLPAACCAPLVWRRWIVASGANRRPVG